MNFHEPKWISILSILLLCLFLLWGLVWKIGARTESWKVALLQTLSLACICLALARPFLKYSSKYERVIALVDVSESMDQEVGQILLDKLRKYENSLGEINVVPFAATRAPLQIPLSKVPSYANLREAWKSVGIKNTNLEASFLALISSFKQESKVPLVLLSDGQETQGKVELLPQAVRGQEFQIFPFVENDSLMSANDFKLSQLDAPLVASQKKEVDIRASIINENNESRAGLLKVTHGDKIVFNQKVTLEPNSEMLFIAHSNPSQEGIQKIEASFAPDGTNMPTSVKAIYLSTQEPEKLLLLNGAKEDELLLKEVFANQAYKIESVIAKQEPEVLPSFDKFSSVILNNIALKQLPLKTAEEASKFVSKGGGFVMVGGNKSFGLGGYAGTPIEDLLPVELIPPRREEKRLNIALEMVIDKSGSMGSEGKLEFAKEAAREVVKNLKDEDYIGVIGFDTTPFEVVVLGQVGKIRSHAIERIGRLYPDKRTNLFPAMEEARRRLEGAQAGRKHMIILTDGKIPDADTTYIEAIKQMRFLGITVSTVMLGSEFDFGFLRSLAEYGGGAYYQTQDANALPKIFMQDVKVRSGELSLKEQNEFPVRLGRGGVKSTSIESYPPVRGFVETKVKEKANLELVAVGAEGAYPLLASWDYGKGKATAFTSDANGRWSNYWASWPKFSRFWLEVVDSLHSSQGRKNEILDFELRQKIDRGVLKLQVNIFTDYKEGELIGELVFPDGSLKEIRFSSTVKGSFTASLSEVVSGKYELRAFLDKSKLTPVGFELGAELFGERKGEGFNIELLSKLAKETDGKINPEVEDLKNALKPTQEEKDLSFIFIFFAAALLCLQVLTREVWERGSLTHPVT